MSKAVIYIDIEDDITSIIDRVKASKSDIVALVPPKRTGVLQSIVNLKLLKRAALSGKKRVVLITNDQALVSLAGGVKIPTAKNLQSRPEVASINALEIDNEDVINGEELSVGEMDDAMTGKKPAVLPVAATPSEAATPQAVPLTKAVPLKKGAKGSGGLKVPDFMKFRKKLFIIGGALLVLILLLWWAFWVAPHATVAIKAKTEIANIDRALTLNPSLVQSEPEDGSMKPVTQQIKKNNSVEFTATGKKEVGEKANGTAVIRNCASRNPVSISAGTAFSANGLNFISASDVTVPGGSSSSEFGPCDTPGTASVRLNAQEIGEAYNLAGGTSFDIAGTSINAVTNDGTSGGSKRQVTIVSEADVAKARSEASKQDENKAKEELADKFEEDYQVLSESFRSDTADPSVSPAVGQEASKATLTIETTYTMMAVNKKDLNTLLDAAVNDEIGNDTNKSIYDNGREDIEIREYQSLDGGRATMRIKTTGYIGAKIDEKQLKEGMRGKRYGEIESLVKEIPNVESVDIKFSPFWVTAAPAPDKIELKFEISKHDQE